MDFKIIIPLLFICSLSATASTPIDRDNEVKYAVSYCLSKAYPDSNYAKDALYISGAYLQKGSYGLHVYESIRNFVDGYIQKKYVSKHDKELSIMQCIDLTTSNSLIVEIDKAVSESN